MTFNAGDIRGRVTLDTKQYDKQMAKTRTQAKGFAGDMKGIGLVAAGAMVAGLAMGTRALFKFVESGAKLNDMRKAFEGMSAAAGTSGREVIAGVRGITGALSDKQIIQAANTLELLNIGIERLPKFIQIASAAAVGLGTDTAFMLRSLTTGSARQSRLMLDNLGILISVEEANRTYAASIGKTVRQLTDQEQRTGFLNAVMEKGDRIINKVGVSADSQSEKVGALGASWSNFIDTLKRLGGDAATIGGSGSIGAQALGWLDSGTKQLQMWLTLITDIKRIQADVALAAGGPGDTLPIPPRRRAPVNVDYQVNQMGTPTPFPPIGGGGESYYPRFDYGKIDVPQLSQGMDALTTKTQGLYAILGAGSAAAAQAFAGNMIGALGSVARSMGNFLISAAQGIGGLLSLNPALALGAGFLLTTLGSLGLGGGSSMPTARSVPTSIGSVGGGGGALTIVVNGDFMGDRVWVDRLAEKIRRAESRRGVKASIT